MQITSVRYRELVSLRGCEHKALEATVGLDPSTTMSTSRPSVTMSTVMSGYRRRYSNTIGSICRAAPADVLMRSVPAGVAR